MPKKAQHDPSTYLPLRAHALTTRFPDLAPDALHAILMDWPINNATTTVLATAGGTAELFLSTGEHFLTTEPVPAIRKAALRAMHLATHDHGDARPTTETPIPTSPNAVFFYFVYSSGLLLSRANEATLRDGTNHLQPLGIAMQNIVTQFRLWHQSKASQKNS